jgi:autophagy-related protein 2
MKLDMIRFQVRCPPPPVCLPRSGALLIDFYEIKITTGATSLAQEQGLRFSEASPLDTPVLPKNVDETTLMNVEFKRLLVACAPIRQHMATSILSLGSLYSDSQDFRETLPALQPRLAITKLMSHSKDSVSVTMLSFNIPFVQIDISKDVLDGLQFWTDDVTQLLERTFNTDGDDTQPKNTKSVRPRGTSEMIMKIAISDGISHAAFPIASLRIRQLLLGQWFQNCRINVFFILFSYPPSTPASSLISTLRGR